MLPHAVLSVASPVTCTIKPQARDARLIMLALKITLTEIGDTGMSSSPFQTGCVSLYCFTAKTAYHYSCSELTGDEEVLFENCSLVWPKLSVVSFFSMLYKNCKYRICLRCFFILWKKLWRIHSCSTVELWLVATISISVTTQSQCRWILGNVRGLHGGRRCVEKNNLYSFPSLGLVSNSVVWW